MKKHLKKLVLVIAGGTKNYDRQEISCRETWASSEAHDCDTKIFFVRGIPSSKHTMSESQILSAKVEVEHDTRTVFAEVPDAWEHCFFKQIVALRELSKYYSWDYLVRPNTGSYINLNILNEDLKKLQTKNLVYSVHNHFMGIHYGSGACFTVTADLSEKLLVKETIEKAIHIQMNNLIADDVLMGMIMGGDIIDAPRIEINRIKLDEGAPSGPYFNPQGTPIGPQVTDDPSTWFDPKVYHYYFASSQTTKAHYRIHKLFTKNICNDNNY